MPYKSKAQQRWMYAAEDRGEVDPGTADRWSDETPNIKSLPEKVRQEKNGRAKAAQVLGLEKEAVVGAALRTVAPGAIIGGGTGALAAEEGNKLRGALTGAGIGALTQVPAAWLGGAGGVGIRKGLQQMGLAKKAPALKHSPEWMNAMPEGRMTNLLSNLSGPEMLSAAAGSTAGGLAAPIMAARAVQKDPNKKEAEMKKQAQGYGEPQQQLTPEQLMYIMYMMHQQQQQDPQQYDTSTRVDNFLPGEEQGGGGQPELPPRLSEVAQPEAQPQTLRPQLKAMEGGMEGVGTGSSQISPNVVPKQAMDKIAIDPKLLAAYTLPGAAIGGGVGAATAEEDDRLMGALRGAGIGAAAQFPGMVAGGALGLGARKGLNRLGITDKWTRDVVPSTIRERISPDELQAIAGGALAGGAALPALGGYRSEKKMKKHREKEAQDTPPEPTFMEQVPGAVGMGAGVLGGLGAGYGTGHLLDKLPIKNPYARGGLSLLGAGTVGLPASVLGGILGSDVAERLTLPDETRAKILYHMADPEVEGEEDIQNWALKEWQKARGSKEGSFKKTCSILGRQEALQKIGF